MNQPLCKAASLFCLMILPLTLVRADERGQSIMFSDNPGYQTKTPIDSVNDGGDRCAELAKKVEELKGKPQQRFAAKQAFEAECINHPGQQ